MSVPAPHFLLFSEANGRQQTGHWRFLLKSADGAAELEAADAEPETQGERLELLAVVRGLEALEQPSRVTLVTPSKYVHRGLLYGLEEWRTNGWSWEHFGQMVPVKNRDLWQRLDNALAYHDLEFRPWRFDQGAPGLSENENAEDTAPRRADTRGDGSSEGAVVAIGPASTRRFDRPVQARDDARPNGGGERAPKRDGARQSGVWSRLGNWLRRWSGAASQTAFAR